MSMSSCEELIHLSSLSRSLQFCDLTWVGEVWELILQYQVVTEVWDRACQPQDTPPNTYFSTLDAGTVVPLLQSQLTGKMAISFSSTPEGISTLLCEMGRSILLSMLFGNTTSNGKVPVEVNECKGISHAGQWRQRTFSLWELGIIVLNDLETRFLHHKYWPVIL